MKAKASQENRFVRILTTPIRALCKARDLYVRSMLDCANSDAIGLQRSSQGPSLPRSFSVASSRSYNDNADRRELVRAVSARSIGSRSLDQIRVGPAIGPRALPPRSISVAMGRIDEERPSIYFGEDTKIGNNNNSNSMVGFGKNNELKYPRSKSHAIARTSF